MNFLEYFANHLQDAAADSARYTRRADGSTRIFRGCNFLMFGDINQLAPIPATAALFRPPVEKKTRTAQKALDIFWSNGPDALNFFQELVVQMRIDDAWYNVSLMECRAGSLSEEMYNFMMGFPTSTQAHGCRLIRMEVNDFYVRMQHARS